MKRARSSGRLARPGSAVAGSSLALPHERDESPDAAPVAPDENIKQAKRDLDRGLVDTELRTAAGLDAERREKLLRGAGAAPQVTEDR